MNELQVVEKVITGIPILIRPSDKYVNATSLCKAAGKLFKHYSENSSSKEFVKELSAVAGIPATALIQSVTGGPRMLRGHGFTRKLLFM